MKLRPITFKAVLWLLFGAIAMPALATLSVGVVALALWQVPTGLTVGVLTLIFSVFVLAGAGVTFGLVAYQNKKARQQVEFVAHVSHELRTPLAGIKMAVETLKMGRARTAEDQSMLLDVILRETARLSNLVEQLLGFKDGGLGRAPIRVEDPGALVGEIVATYPVSPNDRERLTVAIDAGLPAIIADPEGLCEAVTNLIRNALTHGAQSTVEIAVRGDETKLTIAVADHGPGIAPKDQKRIFKAFSRGASTTDGAVPGLGLGLAIVAGFAKSAGGFVTFRPTDGGGATFELTIPTAGPNGG